MTSQAWATRLAGSWASRWCSSVLPVRGRPTMKRGCRIRSSAIPGWRLRSSTSRRRLARSDSVSRRAARRPRNVSCASVSYPRSRMRSGSRNSSPPKSRRPPARRLAASRREGSSRAPGRYPMRSSRGPDALRARTPARRRAGVLGMMADRKASAERGQIATARLLAAAAARPLLTVLVSLVLATGASVYTAHTLTFVTSPLRLLPQSERYVVLLKEYLRDFGELNDIVVAVESPSSERSRAYAARLVGALRAAPNHLPAIVYHIDPAYFEQRGLLYLSVDQLVKLRDRLFDYQEFIESYAAHPTLIRLLDALNQQIA